MKRVALYVRVSTGDQTVANQLRDLRAVARRHKWEIVATIKDEGISGAISARGGFMQLQRLIMKRECDLVAVWSIDRLGRSLTHLVAFLELLQRKNVDLYVDKQGLDTSTSAGRAMFQMCGVFAEFEREIMRERIMSGQARARAKGKHMGRPRISRAKEDLIKRDLAKGYGVQRAALRNGVGVGTAQRVKESMKNE
jgi:DNA invertase Pin-like site-specific DNA recombinase